MHLSTAKRVTVLLLVLLSVLLHSGLAEEQGPQLPELGVNHQTGQPLRVGGDKVKLNDLGPTIVGEDGTVKRIADWASLTPAEQALARDRIRKRNEERLAKLQTKAQEEDRHDSTLVFDNLADRGGKSDADLDLERRQQLKGFVDSLNALKASAGDEELPGFDSAFLQDPRLPSKRQVDVEALKAQLEKLQQATDKLTGKDKLNVHEDL